MQDPPEHVEGEKGAVMLKLPQARQCIDPTSQHSEPTSSGGAQFRQLSAYASTTESLTEE